MMSAPVNVKLRNPTVDIQNWQQEAAQWKTLNKEIGGHPDFFPLTIKAAYVIGVIHDICESVSILLKHPRVSETTYIPAYGIFASGIEILGRCINGNRTTRGSDQDLRTGFKWLASSSYQSVPDDCEFIRTSSDAHTIEMLAALRHFAAHGQATSKRAKLGTYQFGNIDYEILSTMPPLIADGLERYWHKLGNSDTLCNNLAKANVIALRNWPVRKSWLLFERDKSGKYHSITDIFNRFDWRLSE